jgi:hypothetical protein
LVGIVPLDQCSTTSTGSSVTASPTDIAQAANPFIASWRWVLVSLKHPEPVVRS